MFLLLILVKLFVNNIPNLDGCVGGAIGLNKWNPAFWAAFATTLAKSESVYTEPSEELATLDRGLEVLLLSVTLVHDGAGP